MVVSRLEAEVGSAEGGRAGAAWAALRDTQTFLLKRNLAPILDRKGVRAAEEVKVGSAPPPEGPPKVPSKVPPLSQATKLPFLRINRVLPPLSSPGPAQRGAPLL